MGAEKKPLKTKTVSLVGGGRMGQALLGGLKKIPVKKILVAEPLAENQKKIKKILSVAEVFSDNLKVLKSDILILSVKPQVIKGVASEIKGKISPGVLVISIAAGIPLFWLKRQFPKNPVIRVMPNNPATIGCGITALCAGKKVKPAEKKLAEEIFNSVGKTFWVSENFLNLITAISGSGPAFFYFFVEALVEAGQKAGLSFGDSLMLTVQTGLGSMKMLEQTGLPPRELINQVASPGGTTLAGLKILEEDGFKNLLQQAIQAATRRARELSQIE
jgi:pyrroline-5-carboxylate reductase